MKDSLRKKGYRDAWIIAFKDGVRVPVSDVAGY